jgi:hypothetical protein
MSERGTNHDPQTGEGAVWGDEFIDTGDANDPVENEPGSQEPPATDPSPA